LSRLFIWAAGGLGALGGACRGGQEDSLSREAVRITSAVRALRDAPNADKVLLVESVANTSCTAADLCSLRATCLDGYRRHLRALGEAHHAGAAGAPAELLARAERELEAAHELTERCARAEAEVRSKYRL
jgi:hypothetical protein